MQLNEIMRKALDRDPQRKAIEYRGSWYTWGWLSSNAARISALLDAGGVHANEPVGVIARNRPSMVATLLSLMASRRSIVMIYAFQSSDAIARDIASLKLPAIIAEAEDWSEDALLACQLAGSQALRTHMDKEDVAVVIEGLESRVGVDLRAPSADLFIEMLTSGTTGIPKRLPLSYELIARSMLGESTEASAEEIEKPDLAPALIMFPFGNISGLYSYFPLAAIGQPVVLLEKFNLAQWCDFVKRFRPTVMNLPTAGVSMLLEAKISKEDLNSLQYLRSGAAALDRNVQLEFQKTYGIPILLSYGATEFGGVVTSMTPELYEEFGSEKSGSVGRPWAGTQLRIMDLDNGRELPPGETGVLELLTPRCGADWVRTTDLASIDNDGFLYHRGRSDGAITRGGYKILPDAVAEKLTLHPDVAAAAVVGLPDERLGQIPVAAIEIKAGHIHPSDENLRAHARKHLYATHIPAAFLIVESLPRTPSMKVSLPEVRALFEKYSSATQETASRAQPNNKA